DMLIGQSAGELAALVAAGSLTLEDGLKAIHSRTVAVLEMPTDDPGQMAALACSSEQVPELLVGLPGYATLAADNGPRACIVSADRYAFPVLVELCASRGIECTVLAVSHGYHSELIGKARPAYRRVLEGLHFRKPQVSLISTIDGEAYGDRPLEEYPLFLASQFVEPVRLRQSISEAWRQGARIFLEAGPKWGLTQFTREILKGQPHGAIASIHPKVGDMEQFKRLTGFAFVNGVGQLSPEGASTGRSAEVEETLLQLPLEGLLEPESVRKVALALGQAFGVDASVAAPEDLRTFEAVVSLVERLRSGGLGEGLAATAQPPAAQPPAQQVPPAAAPAAENPALLEEEVRRVLLDNVVAKTGYPEDMLELDLDLEADLGIDTVKQVDIFARTREHFGVGRDPDRTLRDFNTLRKVIEHIVERVLATGSRPAPQPSAAALSAAATTAAPSSASPSGSGSPRSVREALLTMDLLRAGVKNEELRRLTQALSSRLGVSPPEEGELRTLLELIQRLGKEQ
ncbi:MAG TPA: acyltransferase domain-containing protein, partial [Myxococcaceae bacterium]|nr:acyltransferase domain-containing protein [Myxococcaceae bacterium]